MTQLQNARWITPLGVEKILYALGVDATRCTALNWTENVTVGSVTITALPARHFSGRSLFNRFETLWASFAFVGPSIASITARLRGVGWLRRHRQAVWTVLISPCLRSALRTPLWADIHIGPGRSDPQLSCSW